MMHLGDSLIEADLRRETVHQAGKDYSVQQAIKSRSLGFRVHRRWLARLGDLLVMWGRQLQTRFATEAQPNSCVG